MDTIQLLDNIFQSPCPSLNLCGGPAHVSGAIGSPGALLTGSSEWKVSVRPAMFELAPRFHHYASLDL